MKNTILLLLCCLLLGGFCNPVFAQELQGRVDYSNLNTPATTQADNTPSFETRIPSVHLGSRAEGFSHIGGSNRGTVIDWNQWYYRNLSMLFEHWHPRQACLGEIYVDFTCYRDGRIEVKDRTSSLQPKKSDAPQSEVIFHQDVVNAVNEVLASKAIVFPRDSKWEKVSFITLFRISDSGKPGVQPWSHSTVEVE